ncbi:MAG: hypothetical protein ACP5RI_04165, partial [Candidatus Micrarchaeia archaeon]
MNLIIKYNKLQNEYKKILTVAKKQYIKIIISKKYSKVINREGIIEKQLNKYIAMEMEIEKLENELNKLKFTEEEEKEIEEHVFDKRLI